MTIPLATLGFSDIETALRIGELLVAVGAVAYLRKIARLLGVFDDYPPHRHINGKITYPKGYSPEPVEQMWCPPDSCEP